MLVSLGFIRAFLLNALSWGVELLGLLVVWFALPFAHNYDNTNQRFTQYPDLGWWCLVRLPRWARWWDNQFDGMLGDKRGWWANECKGEHMSRYNMWRWAAIRNPANYFGRNVCGVDVSTLKITQVAGGISDEGTDGFFVLKGVSADGKVYPRFYGEYKLSKTNGLMFDFGWKIKLSHNGRSPDAPESERIKGIVFTGSFWKELT